MQPPGPPRCYKEKEGSISDTRSMGRVHDAYCRWVRGCVIPGKVGQDYKDTEVNGRDSQQQKRKTNNKGSAITLGIPGVLHQEL